jgi:hypothetical protein
MPRPGQDGALKFDKTNVSEFLRRWNIECEDYGLTDAQKCSRVGDYCIKEVKEVIELLPGYTEGNWETLQKELKSTYWQHDQQRDTTASLNQLIKDAPSLDLNVYILKYTAISSTLVNKGALSSLDRVGRLLDGLSADLRRRVLKYCAKNDWRLSAHDTGTVDPNFDDLRKFIITEAQATQKETVYATERASREGSLTTTTTVAMGVTTNVPGTEQPTVAVTPIPSTPASVDPIAELTRQFKSLALAIQANMSNQPQQTRSDNTNGSNSSRGSFTRVCPYCDVPEHTNKWRCDEFKDDYAKGRVGVNELGQVINPATGEKLPLMFGRGGMKVHLAKLKAPAPTAPTVNNITFSEGPTASVGENTVHLVTIQDDGSELHEIIDVDVYEKRRRTAKGSAQLPETNPHHQPVPGQDFEEIVNPHRTRETTRRETEFLGHEYTPAPPPTPEPVQQINGSRQPTPSVSGPFQPTQSTQPPASSRQPTPARSEGFQQPSGTPSDSVHSRNSTPSATRTTEDSPMRDAHTRERRFRLASDLRENITIAEIGEKIMQMPISLTFGEVFAASPDLAAHFADQARKRRRPIEHTSATAEATAGTTTVAHVNQTFYALPSGRAKTIVDDNLTISALLDHGSELVLMPRRVFERLDLPYDREIDWRINGYSKAQEHAPNDLVGVCHSVKLSVGGVDAYLPVFIVEDLANDLILGRPWERKVRATLINEDDGSVTVIIKSQDGRRIVRFCAVKAEHERNRLYARPPDQHAIGQQWGKA